MSDLAVQILSGSSKSATDEHGLTRMILQRHPCRSVADVERTQCRNTPVCRTHQFAASRNTCCREEDS